MVSDIVMQGSGWVCKVLFSEYVAWETGQLVDEND